MGWFGGKTHYFWKHPYLLTPRTGWWFQIFFIFNPKIGKIPILTHIFQMGWNHQLEKDEHGTWEFSPLEKEKTIFQSIISGSMLIFGGVHITLIYLHVCIYHEIYLVLSYIYHVEYYPNVGNDATHWVFGWYDLGWLSSWHIFHDDFCALSKSSPR